MHLFSKDPIETLVVFFVWIPQYRSPRGTCWFVSSLWSCFSITTVAERLGAELLVPAETKLGRLDGGEGGVVDSGSGGGTGTVKSTRAPFVQLFVFSAGKMKRDKKTTIAANGSLPQDGMFISHYLSSEGY